MEERAPPTGSPHGGHGGQGAQGGHGGHAPHGAHGAHGTPPAGPAPPPPDEEDFRTCQFCGRFDEAFDEEKLDLYATQASNPGLADPRQMPHRARTPDSQAGSHTGLLLTRVRLTLDP
eukprot:scaffold18652_cov33-Phaeocystis_antarctica.AAC.1